MTLGSFFMNTVDGWELCEIEEVHSWLNEQLQALCCHSESMGSGLLNLGIFFLRETGYILFIKFIFVIVLNGYTVFYFVDTSFC